MFRSLSSNHSPEWVESVFAQKNRSVIRALIVADGKVDFNINPLGFGLTKLLEVLEGGRMPWEVFEIKTAHRFPDTVPTGAQLTGFKFDALENGVPIFSRKLYDEVWLFGSEGKTSSSVLEQSERDVITRFMDEGGGVFATGDHEDLGFALCGTIPRVRHMRRWEFDPKSGDGTAPSQFGATRIDSLREGTTPGFEEPDEGDAFPQEIRPKFFINEASMKAEPHPLLALGKFAISVLPDHMHEGECVSPKEIATSIENNSNNVKDDFPTTSDGKPLLPTIVAISTSAGGMFLEGKIEPVEPRSYIVISAYDGQLVERHDKETGKPSCLGRVVVDASFHHFVNSNITGLSVAGGGSFDAICKYYRNILMWLRPADKQLDYYVYLLLGLRFTPPLLEEIRKDSERTLENILHAGRITSGAIERHLSSAEARSCALALASTLPGELGRLIRRLVSPWQPRTTVNKALVFLSSDKVLFLILGSAILQIASKLPETQHTAATVISELSLQWDSFLAEVAQGVSQGGALLEGVFADLSKLSSSLSNGSSPK